MKSYTFYLHDADHPTPAFDFVHCDDDDEAFAHARMLLGRFPEYELIEVYDGRSTRVTVRRDPPVAPGQDWSQAVAG
jgi:hypothetical protein